MKKKLNTFGIICLFMLGIYAMTYTWASGDDALMCQLHGYPNSSTSLSLEGFCEKEVAPNVTKSVRVENLLGFDRRHERESRVAMCIRNRVDPIAC